MRDGRLKGPAITSRFPAVFRLPAFRFSVIRFPPRDWAFLTVGLPDETSAGPRRGLPRFARTSYDRGGCLLCPEDGGALPGWAGFPADACRFPAASPCAPLPHPIGGADRNETSVGGLGSSPVRSASRLWPPDGTGALGLLPDASNPAGNASDARQAEARPRARARNYAFDLRRTSKQRVHSYACDLASQTRPVFPSPAAARMERAAAWAFPRASHPADQEPDDARRGGDRPSSTDLELHAQHHIGRSSNPVVHSMRATSRRSAHFETLVACGGMLLPYRRQVPVEGRCVWHRGPEWNPGDVFTLYAYFV